MANLAGKSAWIATGVVLLLALAMVPTISSAAHPGAGSGVAAASSTGTCSPSGTSSGGGGPPPSDTQWAYGGQGWSNWTLSFDDVTITYNSSFGWTVVFTVVSNSTTGITMLEEQRTLGINVWSNVTKPNFTVSYLYHAQEMDGAFANVTNGSTVYVDGQAVPALGILNASVAACSEINQALQVANATVTRTASLNVTGVAEASVAFSPSLGLVPLNLTGVSMWNSSATATSAASWNVSYAFTTLGGKSGSGSKAGSLSGTAEVYLTGYRCWAHHLFSDHKSRLGVIVSLQGPFQGYDGFVLLPHGFDFFGTAPHGYDSYGFGSAGISSESLYLSPGPGGLSITAADQSFGAVNSGVNGFAGPDFGLASPEAPGGPAATVYGQPMSVSQAHAVDQGLTGTPGFSGRAPLHGASGLASSANLVVVLVAVVVAVVVGTVVAVEWASVKRRRSTNGGGSNPSEEVSSTDRNRPQ
jgi:hypothetical protein